VSAAAGNWQCEIKDGHVRKRESMTSLPLGRIRALKGYLVRLHVRNDARRNISQHQVLNLGDCFGLSVEIAGKHITI
jgi:hypothetical protein